VQEKLWQNACPKGFDNTGTDVRSQLLHMKAAFSFFVVKAFEESSTPCVTGSYCCLSLNSNGESLSA